MADRAAVVCLATSAMTSVGSVTLWPSVEMMEVSLPDLLFLLYAVSIICRARLGW